MPFQNCRIFQFYRNLPETALAFVYDVQRPLMSVEVHAGQSVQSSPLLKSQRSSCTSTEPVERVLTAKNL